jgi:hypothetical protein
MAQSSSSMKKPKAKRDHLRAKMPKLPKPVVAKTSAKLPAKIAKMPVAAKKPAGPKLARHPGPEPVLHLIKLCVGVTDIADLAAWQKKRRAEAKRPYNIHVTRAFPKRGEALLAGGSLYWVIQGRIRVRQRLIGIGEHVGNRNDDGGVPHCELQLDPRLIEVAARHHRPFQGWRYLDPKDAPPDIGDRTGRGDALPPALEAELRELGLL